MKAALRAWFRNLFRRRTVEDSLDEELRACVDILASHKEQAGLAPADARREALLEIGGVEIVKERVRDVRRGSMVDTFVRDVRHTVRLFRKQPLLTVAIVLTLGIGLGSPASAFSLLNHYIFSPPPSADASAFFRLSKKLGSGHETTIGIDEYIAFRDRATSAREVAAWSVWMMRGPLGVDDPAPAVGSLVSCNLQAVFKIDVPVAGRLLTASDCERDTPIAIMNERTWRTRFGGDPSIVGATLRYGAAQIEVVGIAAAPSLRRQWDDADELVDLFVPYTAYRQMKGVAEFARSGHGWLHVGGLLRPGVDRAAAAAEFRSIALAVSANAVDRPPLIGLTNGSRWEEAPTEMLGILAMVLALPSLILFMACVNVSALLLSRSVSRRPEMAIRLALGTSRGALVRMLLTETLLMAAVAAGIALVFVAALPPVIVRMFDAATWFGSTEALRPGWRVLAALGICGAVAAVLAGLTPALASLNPRPLESLKGRPESGPRGSSRTRRWLVGLQVAASMVPLVVAAAFSNALTRTADSSFRTSDLLVARVPDVKPRDVALGRIAEALSTSAGVAAVAFADGMPLVGEASIRVVTPGSDGEIAPVVTAVSRNYFEAVGLSLLAGRVFDARDQDPGATIKPVVISGRLASRLFGIGRGVGERIDARVAPRTTEAWTVVGIVTDRMIGRTMSRSALSDGSMIYRPMPESSKGGVLLVKAAGDVDAAASAVRERLRVELGSAAAVRTLDAVLAEELSFVRRLSVVALALGVLAFLLAIVGIVGTVSFDARQRRKEFAVRQALGAAPWVVARRVIASGLTPVWPAIALGVLGSWGALSVADSERLSPFQPIAGDVAPYIAIGVLLLLSVLATLLAIAHPASRRDPLLALREE